MQNIFLSLTCLLFAYNLFGCQTGQDAQISGNKFAVYLTTGGDSYRPHREWGGCHITMAGFHPINGSENKILKLSQLSKETSSTLNGWRPSNVQVCKRKNCWRIVFWSHTLNKIVKQLHEDGFQKVKGPAYCGSPFHMTLPHIRTQEAAEAFARQLMSKEWYITVVEENPASGHFHWTKYFLL